MAVDYTKVFTVWGKYLKYLNAYQAYISQYTTDQTAIETVLSAQSLVRLEDGLTGMFNDFKNDIAQGTSEIISRITAVLTDETLIGANFSFGQTPNLTVVWPALIHDMAGNDKNVTTNTSTVGSKTYDTHNGDVGVLQTGTKLDGVSSPMAGAPAILDYMGLTTQLTPDSEILTFTCIADSESGGQLRGSEVFEITGTGSGASPYSPTGENIGSLGNIQVVDNQAAQFLSNAGFDTWGDDDAPSSWTQVNGGPGVDYEEGDVTLYDSGASLLTIQADGEFEISQTIPNSRFERRKAYWLTCWAAKSTDAGGDQVVEITLGDDGGVFETLTVEPTTTAWAHFALQFIPPIEIEGDVVVTVGYGVLAPTNDPIFIDQIVIVPCEYHAGVAVAVFGGPEKWLVGDQIHVPLSNNNNGKFQTNARKAYRVQLPVDATPTISDSLAT